MTSAGGDAGGGGGGGGGPRPPPSGADAAVLHVVNGVVALGILGLCVSIGLLIARACGLAPLIPAPDPWCPAALCVDCGSQGGCPLCLEVSGAGECGMVVAVLAGTALVALGVAASAAMTWQLLSLGAAAALDKAQKMVCACSREEKQGRAVACCEGLHGCRPPHAAAPPVVPVFAPPSPRSRTFTRTSPARRSTRRALQKRKRSACTIAPVAVCNLYIPLCTPSPAPAPACAPRDTTRGARAPRATTLPRPRPPAERNAHD
jgi:hypothetical protein